MSEEYAQPERPVSRFEVRQYGDTEGRRITQICPLDGSPVQHRGQATRIVQVGPGKQQGIPFGFQIEADRIEDAFDGYDAARNAEWVIVFAKLQEQAAAARMPKIAIAGSSPSFPSDCRHDGQGLQMP